MSIVASGARDCGGIDGASALITRYCPGDGNFEERGGVVFSEENGTGSFLWEFEGVPPR